MKSKSPLDARSHDVFEAIPFWKFATTAKRSHLSFFMFLSRTYLICLR